ncbi:hypothetical protein Hanom_Chr04g00357531 [Helianthus anomalus]
MGKICKKRLMYDMAMLHFGLAFGFEAFCNECCYYQGQILFSQTCNCTLDKVRFYYILYFSHAAIEKLHVPDELEDNL